MRLYQALPDVSLGDEIVTLTELRVGDVVRLERLDARTVGLRALDPDEAARHAGFLFRIESGERPGAVRLVQLRGPGPLN